jgi:hypothetical protein
MGWERHRGKLLGALALFTALAGAHRAIPPATRIEPPAVTLPPPGAARSWTRVRGGLREVYLEGSPEAIGAAHTRLLRDHMAESERRLQAVFARSVPFWPARAFIEDFSRVRYRALDEQVPAARRAELAAQALAFSPDPFEERMPTYQRMLFLHALYDVALSFEHSPLIGCTSFAFPSPEGHEIVGRTFDFETDPIFDSDKAVYLVREDGAVPFASVAWPGVVGVVTGMNAEGVVMLVHGARAGEPAARGVPVLLSLREALGHARSTDEAVALLAAQPVMVSHMVFVADGQGHTAVVERAPGQAAFARRAQGIAFVTNHLEGPLAGDPKNQRVREHTSTLDRAERVRQLLDRPAAELTESYALAMLRDHTCARASDCPLGDRRAIDALIATHGVVADATARRLWVSVGPHLSGRFVRLDVGELLAPGHDPASDGEPESWPEDPILRDGRFDAAVAGRGP